MIEEARMLKVEKIYQTLLEHSISVVDKICADQELFDAQEIDWYLGVSRGRDEFWHIAFTLALGITPETSAFVYSALGNKTPKQVLHEAGFFTKRSNKMISKELKERFEELKKKKWTTRNGCPVRFLGVIDAKSYPFVIVILGDEQEYIETVTTDLCRVADKPTTRLKEVFPYEDWPIDALIYVWSNHELHKQKGHFAGVNEEGLPMTWECGRTSFTTVNKASFMGSCRASGGRNILTAKEAFALSGPLEDIYLKELESYIRKAAESGKRSVIIHDNPYAVWLCTAEKLPEGAIKALTKLKDLGYKTSIYRTPRSTGLRISWN